MTHISPKGPLEPHNSRRSRPRTDVPAWQQLDATRKLCLVEQALRPRLLADGYPAAL